MDILNVDSPNLVDDCHMLAEMESGFDPYQLAHSKTTVYVVIPTDKLQSHSRWLRLVTTSMMRAVIRKPN